MLYVRFAVGQSFYYCVCHLTQGQLLVISTNIDGGEGSGGELKSSVVQCTAALKPTVGSDDPAWLYKLDLTEMHDKPVHDKFGAY